MHGFASQGIAYTDDNNWLTMQTSVGSYSFTDFGGNVSMPVTDKFRIGAQIYDRNLGQLGKWHPSLDWAILDFKYKPWLSIRGGKVKTVIGLYNDTQDLDFLHTFALLPQSVYAIDLRDSTIAHRGGDVYGSFRLRHHMGSLSYTVYAGQRSDSIYSGYPYLLKSYNINIRSYGGLVYGGDLRWQTPLKDLLVGASRIDEDITGKGTGSAPGNGGGGSPRAVNAAVSTSAYEEHSRQDWANQFYEQYTHGKLHLDAEYRRYLRDQRIANGFAENVVDVRGWYVAGTYQLLKRLTIGSYYSRYNVSSVAPGLGGGPNPLTDAANHDYDKVVTGRVDISRFWNVKVEGHFMDGYGTAAYPNGFYSQQNPGGFQRNTNALVVKTGFNF